MYEREIAGVGIFSAVLLLIWKGHVQEALYLALPTVAFFIGELNGKRASTEKQD